MSLIHDDLSIARRCPQFGMCRTNFLGTGVCPAGRKHGYVAYYPQGRMLLAGALAEDAVPLTEGLVSIADSCNLCGICDEQCYFLSELRAGKVMAAVKRSVEDRVASGAEVLTPVMDETLQELASVVGNRWTTNDPAILMSYSRARSPLVPRTVPRYVVLPDSTRQVQDVVEIANRRGIPYVPRGTGTSLGGAMTDGIVLDLVRMKDLEIHPGRFGATVGAGVTAFELQARAAKHGLRANVAEPAACVCANVVSTNLHSLFSHAYGVGADNYTDAEIVGRDGKVFHINDRAAPNTTGYAPSVPGRPAPAPGICTSITVKLYEVADDERALLVPFDDLRPCVELAREIGQRRLGIAAGVIGTRYLSTFSAPTHRAAQDFEGVLTGKLGIRYAVLVIGAEYEIAFLRQKYKVSLDQEMLRTLLLSASSLEDEEGFEVLSSLGDGGPLYRDVLEPGMWPVVETALSPSVEHLIETVDEDMKGFFRKLYSRPELTDAVWLNSFRILSGRMGRRRTFAARILWCPLDDPTLAAAFCAELGGIADRHGVNHGFGYMVPVDHGKRAVLEYDYYFDQAAEEEVEKVRAALAESRAKLQQWESTVEGVCSGEAIVSQGLCRKEAYLYGKLASERAGAV